MKRKKFNHGWTRMGTDRAQSDENRGWKIEDGGRGFNREIVERGEQRRNKVFTTDGHGWVSHGGWSKVVQLTGEMLCFVMCTRYSLSNREIKLLIAEIAVLIATAARYNIGPGTLIKTIIRGPNRYEISEMMWGWQRANNAGLLVNGKSENLHTAFNNIKHQRCLIPADGFYEWTGPKNERQPIRFTKPGNQPFCFAGLWKDVPAESVEVPAIRRHVIVLTTTPNDTVGTFHERMPFIVSADQYGDWLANGKRFERVIEQPDRGELEFCPVQPALNKASNDGVELIRPYAKQQAELF